MPVAMHMKTTLLALILLTGSAAAQVPDTDSPADIVAAPEDYLQVEWVRDLLVQQLDGITLPDCFSEEEASPVLEGLAACFLVDGGAAEARFTVRDAFLDPPERTYWVPAAETFTWEQLDGGYLSANAFLKLWNKSLVDYYFAISIREADTPGMSEVQLLRLYARRVVFDRIIWEHPYLRELEDDSR